MTDRHRHHLISMRKSKHCRERLMMLKRGIKLWWSTRRKRLSRIWWLEYACKIKSALKIGKWYI